MNNEILRAVDRLRQGIYTKHGRIVRVGQIWRSNDPRRFRGVRVLTSYSLTHVKVENIVNGVVSFIALKNFTIGTRGWSLEKEAPCSKA